MPKAKAAKGRLKESRGLALADQILQEDAVKPISRIKKRGRGDEADDEYVDEKLSRKILEQARIQQEELEAEHGVGKKKRPQTTVLGSPEVNIQDSNLESQNISDRLPDDIDDFSLSVDVARL
eukprot:g43511.t1